MPALETLCGYGLADVRKSLCDAVDRRDKRAAQRWTAELVATPGAVGSLWAAYWLTWATAQGAGSASPTIPILLKQTWATVAAAAHEHMNAGGGWPAFRNDPEIRAIASEQTLRLLGQARQTPVVWPTKELTLYDVGNMRQANPPVSADGPIVLKVWQRDDDSVELRNMAGRWLDAIQSGDLRAALSIIAWTLMPMTQQGLALPLKCAERGPAILPAKARGSPLWFWLEVGRAALVHRCADEGLHRGWPTMHAAIAEAFRLHYKRWSASERMRMLLAWTLQIRASFLPQQESLWAADAVHQTLAVIDLPYKEIAAELADPDAPIMRPAATTPTMTAKEEKRAAAERAEAKMAEADALIMASLGLNADDL